MINGTHALLFSPAADADRDFLKDVIGLRHVDAGEGWLIFGLPPAEMGIHPADGKASYDIYLMCDDIEGTVKDLSAKGVEFAGEVTDQGWGLVTAIRLPSGAEMGLYEPRHPTAISG
jgi:predicted enzyme related to lactoylglutathione lyase